MAPKLAESDKGSITTHISTTSVSQVSGREVSACRGEWQMAVFVIGLITAAFSIVEMVVQILQFDNLFGTEYFYKDLQNMLVTFNSNVPVILISVLSASIAFALLSVLLTVTKKGKTYKSQLFYLTHRLFLCMTLLVFFFQIYSYYFYKPSDASKAAVCQEMREDLHSFYEVQFKSAGATENARWAATQMNFKCCGVRSYQDWLVPVHRLPLAIDMSAFIKPTVLPMSCCQSSLKCRFRKEVMVGEIIRNNTDKETTYLTVQTEQADPELCLPAKAYEEGCFPRILQRIESAATHVLVDYIVLVLLHAVLLLAIKKSLRSRPRNSQNQ